MNNCNTTGESCSSPPDKIFLESPLFTALLSLFLFIDAAAIVLKVLTAVALTARTIPIHKSLRVLLFNLLVAEILTGVILMVKTLNSAILSVSTLRPSLRLCRVILWAFATLLPARMFALTTYSCFVFVYIKYGRQRIGTGYVVVALVIIWFMAAALGVDRWVAESLGVFYFRNVTCTPISSRQLIIELRGPSQAIWLIFGGIVPFIVSIVMPIAAYRQEKRYGQHRMMHAMAYKKSVVRLPSFLLISNFLNFCWMVVPALAFGIGSYARSLPVNVEAIMLTFFTCLTISLLPTPVFLLVYLRTLRERVREIVTCHNCACCRKRNAVLLSVDVLAYHTATNCTIPNHYNCT